MNLKRMAFFLLLVFLAAACAQPVHTAAPVGTATETPSLTETLPPSATPTPADTATPLPVTGKLTTQVNVRSGPSRSSASLGLLDGGTTVQIVSRDAGSAWYQILYSAGPQGRGWVAAQYVQVADPTLIPLEATAASGGPRGSVTQKLNVRSGPGTSFSSLGTLEAGTQVTLTGKNTTASWFQIEYASAPGGRGWVAVQYIQTSAAADLPVLDAYGTLVATPPQSAQTTPVSSLTPTVGLAPDDRDSASAPALQIVFALDGTRQFTYSSQLSSPAGDGQDWLEFTPFATDGLHANLAFSLVCRGSGALAVELLQGGSPLSGWGSLACGDVSRPVVLPAGSTYILHLTAVPGPGASLVDYTLTVVNNP